MPTKIPSASIIKKGARELEKLYEEIDKQIGNDQGSKDEAVSDQEIATFLSQRGSKSEAAGAAVASLQAYMRHFSSGSDVPLDDVRKVLGKVPDYVEKARAKNEDLAEMKPTWRAIAVFAQEVTKIGLTAKEIVADRAQKPVGDLDELKSSLAQVEDLFVDVGKSYGSGKITTDAIRAWLAEGPDTVATAKTAVRQLTAYLERRTGKSTFTKAQVGSALKTAFQAFEKNAGDVDDRSKLARTWQNLAAFSDENAIRKRSVADMVGQPSGSTNTTSTPASGGAGSTAVGVPGLPSSVAAFRALDHEDKAAVLDDYGDLQNHYQTTGEVELAKLTGKEREYGDAMKKELLSLVGDFEDHSGVYGTIGDSQIRVEIIKLPSDPPGEGDIVGGRIWMFQQGFHWEELQDVNPDDDDLEMHYDTAAEVEALGVSGDDDISWQVHGLFEPTDGGGAVQLDGSYQYTSDHWEWSGY